MRNLRTEPIGLCACFLVYVGGCGPAFQVKQAGTPVDGIAVRGLSERIDQDPHLFPESDQLVVAHLLQAHAQRKTADDIAWGSSDKGVNMLDQFRTVVSRTSAKDLKILLSMAQQMA